MRCACKYGFVLLAHVGNVIEDGMNYVHSVVDAVHGRHNEQGYAQIRAIARGVSQASGNSDVLAYLNK